MTNQSIQSVASSVMTRAERNQQEIDKVNNYHYNY